MSIRRAWLEKWWEKLATSTFNHPAIEVEDSPVSGLMISTDPDGLREILIPVSRLTSIDESIGTDEIRVRNTSHGADGGSLRPFASIACRSPELGSAFDLFIEHLLITLEDGRQVQDAIRLSLDEFRRLTRAKRVVDAEQLIGALGELHVLHQLVAMSPDATRSWVGWREKRHDFMAGLDGIEVKASGRPDSSHVTIHGVMQLEPADGGRLWLHHCRFEEAPGNAEELLSVERLVERLEELGVPRGEMLDRLESCSIDPETDAWTQTFRFAGCEAYEVSEDFPRIGRSAIPFGASTKIDQLQYRINLGQAHAHRLSDVDRDNHILSFINNLK